MHVEASGARWAGVWFDGEEFGRYDTFGDFFEDVLSMLQDYVGPG